MNREEKQSDPSDPSYGTSKRYLGQRGQEYFGWQNRQRDVGGEIEARKFASFINPQDCVIDFGCGAGYTLASIQCTRRVGVDVNPAARMAAIDNGIECYDDLAEIDECVADIVISNHALEHVPCPVACLQEIRRTLKIGGRLILVIPIDDWRAQTEFVPHEINHHLHTWTPQLIGNSLVEAGYDPRNVQIEILSHAWFRGYHKAYRAWPEWLFDAVCRIYSIAVKRRQLVVHAIKSPP